MPFPIAWDSTPTSFYVTHNVSGLLGMFPVVGGRIEMWWLDPLQGLESRITLNILSHWHFVESAQCTCFEILVCIRKCSFGCNRWFIYMHRCVTSRHQLPCRVVGRSFPSIYGLGLVGKARTSTRINFVSTKSSLSSTSPRMSK